MKKSILSILLSICLVLGLMPLTAFAADEKHDISKEDLVLDADSCSSGCKGHVVTGEVNSGLVWKHHNIVVSGGKHTITLDGVNIKTAPAAKSAIQIQGNSDVTLKLVGDNELHGTLNNAAIWVESGSSLTIEGTGSLKAFAGDYTGSSGAAGIGGCYGDVLNGYSNFGNITINGGNIVAQGSGGGAGIGGGYLTTDQTKKPAATGNITINGGSVMAYGGHGRTNAEANGGAGIGTGYNQDYEGTVTVNGGVVFAQAGNKRCRSIGGTQFLLNGTETKDGNFTTGKNGNAVIIALQGIGDKSQQAKWDAIMVTGEADENSAKLAGSKVVLADKDAKFNVVGNPVLDYDLEIAKGTTLTVGQYEVNGKYHNANLGIAKDSKLANNGVINLGTVVKGSSDHSTLTLFAGKAQTSGEGVLKQVEETAVRLPLTKDLVNMEEVNDLTYNGLKQEAPVNVKLVNLWGYDQDFTTPDEYTVAYADAINAGETTVTVTSTGKGNLIGTDSVALTYSIAKADFKIDVAKKIDIVSGEKDLLSKLPNASVSVDASIKDDLKKLGAGKLTWFMDEEHKTPVTADSLKDLKVGETVTLYWAYNHEDSNFVNGKTGSSVVTITDGSNSNNGSNSGSNNGSADSNTKSPNTGLDENVLFWAIAMLASGAALTGVFASKKRKFNQ